MKNAMYRYSSTKTGWKTPTRCPDSSTSFQRRHGFRTQASPAFPYLLSTERITSTMNPEHENTRESAISKQDMLQRIHVYSSNPISSITSQFQLACVVKVVRTVTFHFGLVHLTDLQRVQLWYIYVKHFPNCHLQLHTHRNQSRRPASTQSTAARDIAPPRSVSSPRESAARCC